MKGPFLLRRSLAMRLALVFGLLSAVVVITMGLAIYLVTARFMKDRIEADLASLAEFYAAYTATSAPDADSLAALAPQITGFFAPQAAYDVRLFSARNGALLSATRDIGPLPSSAALKELQGRRPTFFLTASQDLPDRRYTARSVHAADGTVLAVVEVSREVSESQAFLSTLRLVLAASGGLALAAALLLSLPLARQMVRPLDKMESATQAIASGDFERRLSVTSEDEMGRLAASINHMAADLARLEATRREFIAKISHDLRTPLTAIKGFVVNLQDAAPPELQDSLVVMDEQTDRLIRLVNDLLTLSRLQRGSLHLQRREIDLGYVARSAVSTADEKARRLGVSLTLDVADSLPSISGDADRLQQVVLNLLDNALRATPPGGTVQVNVGTQEDIVQLTVTDDGPGPTAEEAASAFEPYYSGSLGGAGLGLTIAHEIITAHNGQIWLKALAQGGAEAGFALPRNVQPTLGTLE
jgi:signal transduction histidine kinase